jgi:hypothetical protein
LTEGWVIGEEEDGEDRNEAHICSLWSYELWNGEKDNYRKPLRLKKMGQ